MATRIITYKNPDGSTNAIEIFGESNIGQPVIIISPAMGIKAAYYTAFAENLAKHFIAITADLRGHGHSDIRPSIKSDYGYKEMILEDFHSSILETKKLFPENNLFLLGHSLGGQMACLYASRGLEQIDGLILIGCCSVYYKGWDGLKRIKVLLGTQFAGVTASILGYFPGKKVGFGGLEAKRMMQDWSYQSRTGLYKIQNEVFDYETALSNLKVRTLTISFEQDTFSPSKAVKNLYEKFHAEAEIAHFHLLNSDPRNENYDHFNWTKKSNSIVNIIQRWIEPID